MSRSRMSALFLMSQWLVFSVPGWAEEAQPTLPDVSCHIGAADGTRRYRQGVWGIVEVLAVNRTDQVAEAESVAWFIDDPTLQFSRRVVIPPRATLRTTCPLRIPVLPDPAARYLDFLSEQVYPAPKEQSQKSPLEKISASQPLILDTEVPAVGMIADPPPRYPLMGPELYHTANGDAPPEPDQGVYEMLVAVKGELGMSRRVSVIDAKNWSPDPALSDVLDVLVLSSDRLASDVGGLLAVRNWVLGGGRLWIVLNEVQMETVSALLGDAFTTALVDRVNLTHLSLINTRLDPAQQIPVEVDLEQPVELVRVIPAAVTVTDTVNGWPAAFWQPLGAGRVYFTTLSAEAWIRPQIELADFAQGLLDKRPVADVGTLELQPFLSQQIGYRILSRTTVTALLGSFLAASVLAGFWLYRIGRSEQVLWLVPLAVAITSLIFVSVALATRKSVPPTVATVARVAFEPGLGTAHSWGLVAMYNSEASRKPIGAANGGRFFPDMTAMTGERRRIVWTDDGTWHWSQLELPAGVRTAEFERPVPLNKVLDCRARFGPEGLEGTIGPHPFGELRDAVVSVPYEPRMAATIHNGRTFTARARDVLTLGEYSVESWRGDAQVRRKAVYDHLFARPPEFYARPDPVLYAWADQADTGFEFPQARQVNSTLFSTRILLDRTPAGTKVLIPPPFLSCRAVADPAGRRPSAYANTTHRWVESKNAVADWLRFQVPAQVLPLQVERATITFTIRAASRSLEILGVDNGQLVSLLPLSHPIGTYSVVVERPELLTLDAEGGLRFVVRVGGGESVDVDDLMSETPWKMESLHLEVAGTVQGE